LLGSDHAHGRAGNGLAFRLKLLLAAGIVPQLAACAECGEQEHLRGFSPAAGGVVCSSCERAAFSLDEDSYAFLVAALGGPLADAPDCSERALRQVEAGDRRDRRAPRARAPAAAAQRLAEASEEAGVGAPRPGEPLRRDPDLSDLARAATLSTPRLAPLAMRYQVLRPTFTPLRAWSFRATLRDSFAPGLTPCSA